jgi:3-oxoacyl-[acyl-carrier protein] reductase
MVSSFPASGRSELRDDGDAHPASRVALVTGSANGIGCAVAERLARKGHKVAMLDLDDKLAASASRIADATKSRTLACVADVRDAEQVKAAVTRIEAELGPIEILVNSVGGSTPQKGIEEITDSEWHSVLNLNLLSTFVCMRAVVGGMKARKWGRIVNVSSVAGRTRSLFGGCHYTAAKAAIIGLSRQCAHELGPYGITVNVVAPGVTLSERVTARWEAKPADERDFIMSLTPVGRPAAVNEIAAAIEFFCGDDASYLVGAVLDANGGLFIG